MMEREPQMMFYCVNVEDCRYTCEDMQLHTHI